MLAAWLALAAPAHAETVSRLSTRFLARGEQALLEIGVTGAQPTALPEIPAVKGIEIRPAGRGPQTQLLPGRTLEYVFEYLVSSYDTGRPCPALRSRSWPAASKSRTEPIEFTVFNPDDLQWSEAAVGRHQVPLCQLLPGHGLQAPTTARPFRWRSRYSSRAISFVEDWGIPDFERDGLTAWRFQPSAMRGQINLLGMPYVSVAYPSTLTPTRTGKIAIGPANVRLITTQVVMEGILRRVPREANLDGSRSSNSNRSRCRTARRKDSKMRSATSASIVTTSRHRGAGRRPDPAAKSSSAAAATSTRCSPPEPVDTDGWKLYDAAAEQRGDERRELSGTVVFHQFMRPLELKSAIPPFRLVYFDPEEEVL